MCELIESYSMRASGGRLQNQPGRRALQVRHPSACISGRDAVCLAILPLDLQLRVRVNGGEAVKSIVGQRVGIGKPAYNRADG